MPFDEGLAERLGEIIPNRSDLKETRMFGGFGYLLDGKMCVGIHKDTLIIRVGVENAEQILQEPNVRPMDFTGKVMKGWATIEPEALEEDSDLQRYCQLAIDFVETLPKK
ncbi:MAG: TfoX/Sxy family protein [Alphaproteobacteria bacterium]|nr:TfoX/Sxy family protein [Alphaproteobacteria bacterium]